MPNEMGAFGLPPSSELKAEENMRYLVRRLRSIMHALASYLVQICEVLEHRLILGLTNEGFNDGEARSNARAILAPLREMATTCGDMMQCAARFGNLFSALYVGSIKEKRAEKSKANNDAVRVD